MFQLKKQHVMLYLCYVQVYIFSFRSDTLSFKSPSHNGYWRRRQHDGWSSNGWSSDGWSTNEPFLPAAATSRQCSDDTEGNERCYEDCSN